MAKSGPPVSTKRPSRRHRRRPVNLLLDYARRKRSHVWLETHVWHAKRFHMTQRWGYKIPLYSNERGVRAAYRSAANKCLLLDLSYYCCVELSGPEGLLVKGLSQLSSPATGSSFVSKACLDGTREGRVVLFTAGSYPRSALGEVTFLWKPRTELCQTSVVSQRIEGDVSSVESSLCDRCMWIWTHPAAYRGILDEIVHVFLLSERGSTVAVSKEVQSNETETVEKVIENKSGTADSAAASQAVNCIQNPVYSNGPIRLKSLKDELCRFRLIGPSSLRVLQSALQLSKPYQIRDMTSSADENEMSRDKADSSVPMQVDEPQQCLDGMAPNGKAGAAADWWRNHCSDERNVSLHQEQVDNWDQMLQCQSPAELAPHSVFGLVVRDPRLFLPQKKTSPVEQVPHSVVDNGVSAQVGRLSVNCSKSVLWNERVREEVKRTQLSIAALNEIRSKNLVPGTELRLDDNESSVPVLLIQRPGVRSDNSCGYLGFTCGFDVIIPPGWATAFWISLIYRCAAPAGLTELQGVEFHSGNLLFPSNCPDCPAAMDQNLTSFRENRACYDRMPPAKRCNYEKMGIAAPFHFAWAELVKEWLKRSDCVVSDSQSFYCLRDIRYLRSLSEQCSKTKRRIFKRIRKSDANGLGNHIKESNLVAIGKSMDFTREPCIVPVRIEVCSRGCPSQYSLICIPLDSDLKKGPDLTDPVEPKHARTKKKHLTKCSSTKTKSSEETIIKSDASATQSTIGSEKKKVVKKKVVIKTPSVVYSSLPLSVVENAVGTGSRLVIGYVVQGGFSYSNGHGLALGFVSLQGLLALIAGQKGKGRRINVLVRNTKSLQYRLATLTINMDCR